MKKIFALALLFFAGIQFCQAADFYVSFAEGKWNRDDFQIVKSSRFQMNGAMIQQKDHIVNKVPAGLTAKQLLSSPDTYCALVTKKKFSGNITVSSKMSFDYQMAPLIVIAPELGVSADGKYPEFREHFEVVLYYRGINVWHHRFRNGKQTWYRLAYLAAPFEPGKIYDLNVSIRHTAKGPQMIIRCQNNEFGCALPEGFTAKEYFTGVIACEGVNRFYDFKVTGR